MDDGIETIEIDSLSSFVKHTLDERDESRLTVYRGHASSKWKLRPTLYRALDLTEADAKNRTDKYQYAERILRKSRLADEILERWRECGCSADAIHPRDLATLESEVAKYARQTYIASGRRLSGVETDLKSLLWFFGDLPQESLPYLVQLRNFNAPMRWLDWSSSPLVALYFALAEKSLIDNPVVYKLSVSLDQKGMGPVIVPDYGYLTDEVIGGESRARVQRPSYLIADQSWDLESAVQKIRARGEDTLSLTRYAILPSSVDALRSALDSIGIHDASVFPDDIGLFMRISRAIFDR